jgi:hypothetical protein
VLEAILRTFWPSIEEVLVHSECRVKPPQHHQEVLAIHNNIDARSRVFLVRVNRRSQGKIVPRLNNITAPVLFDVSSEFALPWSVTGRRTRSPAALLTSNADQHEPEPSHRAGCLKIGGHFARAFPFVLPRFVPVTLFSLFSVILLAVYIILCFCSDDQEWPICIQECVCSCLLLPTTSAHAGGSGCSLASSRAFSLRLVLGFLERPTTCHSLLRPCPCGR